MRKTVLSALMMTLLLLSACQGGSGEAGTGQELTAEEAARQIRTEYLAAGSCRGRAQVTADYGLRVYEFELEFTWRQEGETVLTIAAPEEIAGLTARIAQGEARLEFDGASLGTGDLTGEGLTPMELIPALMDDTLQGYMAQCAFERLGEREALRVVFRDPEARAGTGAEHVQWFDRESHALLRCELSWDGELVLSGDFSEFTLGDEESDTKEQGQDLGGDQPGEPGA